MDGTGPKVPMKKSWWGVPSYSIYKMANPSDTNRLTDILRRYKPNLTLYEEYYYKDFHRSPELSRPESRTARIGAEFLNDIGSYRVTEKVGGHGVVGVFENGPGPKVLLHADMDALPVSELTELKYASKKRGVDPEAKEVSVMHAFRSRVLSCRDR